MHSNLIEHIRDDFGAGEYHLMIRQGKTMLFTGPLASDLGPGNRGPTLEPRLVAKSRREVIAGAIRDVKVGIVLGR